MDESTRGKHIDLEVHPSRMRLSVNGEVALEGDFGRERVTPDGSFFGMEGEGEQRTCVVTLEKKDMGHKSWSEFFQEEEVDTSVTDKVRACASDDAAAARGAAAACASAPRGSRRAAHGDASVLSARQGAATSRGWAQNRCHVHSLEHAAEPVAKCACTS